MITLKNVLIVNGLSSGLTGILLLTMSQTITAIFGVLQNGPFLATGLFLVLFASLVLYVASQAEINRSLIKIIIYADSLWVVASLIIVLPQLFGLSLWGYLLISAVAAWVGLMAYLQNAGLRKSLDSSRGLA